jgi:hypothetical protein
MPNVGNELLATPFPAMVEKLALAIADGQTQLDKNSAAVAKAMASADMAIKLPSIADPTDASKDVTLPLIALGFFPKFYEFSQAVIEVKMAISMATSTDVSVGASFKGGWGPVSASVNASYSQKYSYNVEGSSLLRVTMAPVPPPTILQNYMDALVKKMSAPISNVDPTA